MRSAYADPSTRGKASYYPEREDVDYRALVERLVSQFPDGWALPTERRVTGDLRAVRRRDAVAGEHAKAQCPWVAMRHSRSAGGSDRARTWWWPSRSRRRRQACRRARTCALQGPGTEGLLPTRGATEGLYPACMSRWPWWHQSTGPDEYRVRELLRAVWDLHAMYGVDRPWLWRGQANDSYMLEPGIHTRVRHHATLDDDQVEQFTGTLLKAARDAEIDNHEGTRLPDLALLALLQHHGAATPLLDVTLDPIVGLYMAVVSPNDADDDADGVLFAIRRPTESIDDFDSRSFSAVYQPRRARGTAALYSAPDVSERLRIQRGHFLLGPVSTRDPRVTIPLTLDGSSRIRDTWMTKRMRSRGSRGPVAPAASDVAMFRVTAKFKHRVRDWLEERSGLTRDFVYPTAWHQPHLERFAASHGRRADF